MPEDFFWESFPNFARNAISPQIGKKIPWHKYASSTRSSQTFCISAFGPLIDHTLRDQICSRISAKFLQTLNNNESWNVQLEFIDRSLLNEFVGTPSQIDVLLEGTDSVITIEAKLAVDAMEGLGVCGKYHKTKDCKGFYGTGSDQGSPSTWCILERWDGRRSPRLYWSTGRSFFNPEVFLHQTSGDKCPFCDSNFQLMRNFLTAAAMAQKKKKHHFGTIVICPRELSERLTRQVQSFQNEILLPQFRNRVTIGHYEDYIDILLATEDKGLCEIGTFLSNRLSALSSI